MKISKSNDIILHLANVFSIWFNRGQLDSHVFCVPCWAFAVVEIYKENPSLDRYMVEK